MIPPFCDDRLLREDEMDDDFVQAIEEEARRLPDRVKGNGKAAGEPGPRILVLESLHPRTAAAIATSPVEEMEVLVHGLLYAATVLVIGGLAKACKSWLALLLAFCLISAKPFLGHAVPKRRRVLLLNGEGTDATMHKRLLAAIPFSPPGMTDEDLEHLGIVSTLGRVKLDRSPDEQWLMREAEGYDVVIVDPPYRFGSRGSENDHADARTFQDVMDRLKSKGKAVVLCHHLRKPGLVDAGAAELRGAGYSEFADSILLLARKKAGTAERFTLRFTLRYTLRHDEGPRTRSSSLNGPLFEVGEEEGLVTVAHVVQAIQAAGGRIEGRAEFVNRLCEMTGAGKQTAVNAIIGAESTGAIFSARREGQGQAKTYTIAGAEDDA